MDITRREEISKIAQEISFAYEDLYHDMSKRKIFHTLFDKYLSPMDPGGNVHPYDAIIMLGRKEPAEFDRMVMELRENKLIPV